MAKEDVPLPKSSWNEQKKMIEGYFLADQRSNGEPVAVSDVAHRAGMDQTWLSRNNKFFQSLGLISAGNRKRVSDEGRALGLAISHADEKEIRRILGRLVMESDFLSRIVNAVKVRAGMDAESLERHIAITAGAAKSAATTTGVRGVIDLLKESGVLAQDEAGTFRSRQPPDDAVETEASPSEQAGLTDLPITSRVRLGDATQYANWGVPSRPSLTVNLTLNISAENLSEIEPLLRELTGLPRPHSDSDDDSE